MTNEVLFTVEGEPIPKGSWRTAQRRGRKVFFPDNPRSIPWEQHVKLKARLAWKGRTMTTGPVILDLAFTLPRPASHLARISTPAEIVLARGAPEYPTPHGSGDLDKLVRGVMDAMTGEIYKDDAQVIAFRTSKKYADGCKCGVVVKVTLA